MDSSNSARSFDLSEDNIADAIREQLKQSVSLVPKQKSSTQPVTHTDDLNFINQHYMFALESAAVKGSHRKYIGTVITFIKQKLYSFIAKGLLQNYLQAHTDFNACIVRTLNLISSRLDRIDGTTSSKDYDGSYLSFENKFRGPTDVIKKRQEFYIPFFSGFAHSADSYVLDIGCGRGELLELFKENNIVARGVELNADCVSLCRKNGLDVVQQHAADFLKNTPNSSLNGIIACQVIEHIPTREIGDFVKLCKSKLKPGGVIVFETINPKSAYAMRTFYLDMTHEKPVHPEAISFLLEATGFNKVEVRYLNPVPENIQLTPNGDPNIEKINEFLFGYRDFAVIASA